MVAAVNIQQANVVTNAFVTKKVNNYMPTSLLIWSVLHADIAVARKSGDEDRITTMKTLRFNFLLNFFYHT